MFCSKCGNKSPSGARFCQKCGAKIGNSNGTAHLLNPPSSLAELDREPDSFQEQASTPSDYDSTAVNHTDNATFMGYNVLPNRAADIRPAGYNKHRTHMMTPTPSADMDYTFYPGQKADPDQDEPLPNKAPMPDPVEYQIDPIFPKPPKRSIRVITDTDPGKSHMHQMAPRLPEPMQPAGDVTEFSGYQILPAAYNPTQERASHVHYDRVPAQHIELSAGLPEQQHLPAYVPEPQSTPVHNPQQQPMPAYATEQHIPVYASEQQHLPAYAPEPQSTPVHNPQQQPMPAYATEQHMPVYASEPQHLTAYAPEPQPVPIHNPQPQHAAAQTAQPQTAYVNIPQPQSTAAQPQTEYDPEQEMWRTHDEFDDMAAHIPRKKSKLPVILGVLAILIIAAVAAVVLINRFGGVNPDHLIGTWSQSPPLGTWIPRLEFRDDGTGQFYQFNTDHNVPRNEVHFSWSIESGNRMRSSLWPEMAEISFERDARPPRFRYRLESSGEWQSFVLVVET